VTLIYGREVTGSAWPSPFLQPVIPTVAAHAQQAVGGGRALHLDGYVRVEHSKTARAKQPPLLRAQSRTSSSALHSTRMLRETWRRLSPSRSLPGPIPPALPIAPAALRLWRPLPSPRWLRRWRRRHSVAARETIAAARQLPVSAKQRGWPLPPFAGVVASAQCWSVPDAERALHPWAPSASLWRRGLPLPPSAVAVACTRCCVDAELQHGPPLPPSAGVVARARCWSVPEAERALRPWAPSASPWRLKCRRWHHAVAAPIPTVIVR
jgi:hypothetical protein